MKTKNLILLFFILLSICLLTACGGKDNKTAHGIVGKWKFADIEYDVDVPNTDNMDRLEEIFDGYEVAVRDNTSDWTMEFTRDGQAIGGKYPEVDYYTISGDTLFIDTGMQKEMTKFRIEGNTLIFEIDVTRDIVSSISARGDDYNIKKCICRVSFVREK